MAQYRGYYTSGGRSSEPKEEPQPVFVEEEEDFEYDRGGFGNETDDFVAGGGFKRPFSEVDSRDDSSPSSSLHAEKMLRTSSGSFSRSVGYSCLGVHFLLAIPCQMGTV